MASRDNIKSISFFPQNTIVQPRTFLLIQKLVYIQAAAIIEKLKLQKYYNAVSLFFIKNNNKKISDVIEDWGDFELQGSARL